MINDLLAARLQMAVSLGFHILFAVAGMAPVAFGLIDNLQPGGRERLFELRPNGVGDCAHGKMPSCQCLNGKTSIA